MLDGIAVGGFGAAQIALPHQLRNSIAVIDHAFAHDFGRMCREHRDDECLIEEGRRPVNADTLRDQTLQCRSDILAGFVEAALPILRQVRQHREQHEAANEGERVIEAQGIQAAIHRGRIRDAAMPVHRAGADVFDALKQPLTPVGPNDIPEQLSQVADVRVLGDGFGGGCHVCLAPAWGPSMAQMHRCACKNLAASGSIGGAYHPARPRGCDACVGEQETADGHPGIDERIGGV